MHSDPIKKATAHLRERGHALPASLLATWPWAASFAASCVFFMVKSYPSTLMASLQYFYVLLALAYWLTEAWFLRRRWGREHH